MKLSESRILTTHVGSLPRPADVSEMLLAKEDGTLADEAAFDACMTGRGGGRRCAGRSTPGSTSSPTAR